MKVKSLIYCHANKNKTSAQHLSLIRSLQISLQIDFELNFYVLPNIAGYL